MITATLTSCGRFDLLEQTLRSFFKLNHHPIERFIVHDDSSGDLNDALHVCNQFKGVQLYVSDRIGLSASWDKMLSMVETEYVFTCEDDWAFSGNQYFMEQSLAILEADKSVHHVWIREQKDHGHPLSGVHSIAGVPVRDVLHWQGTDWNGFSMNPGLRRVADLRRMFPNGLAEFGDEINCARHTAKFNYKAVALANGACRHIGDGRHTDNFKV